VANLKQYNRLNSASRTNSAYKRPSCDSSTKARIIAQQRKSEYRQTNRTMHGTSLFARTTSRVDSDEEEDSEGEMTHILRKGTNLKQDSACMNLVAARTSVACKRISSNSTTASKDAEVKARIIAERQQSVRLSVCINTDDPETNGTSRQQEDLQSRGVSFGVIQGVHREEERDSLIHNSNQLPAPQPERRPPQIQFDPYIEDRDEASSQPDFLNDRYRPLSTNDVDSDNTSNQPCPENYFGLGPSRSESNELVPMTIHEDSELSNSQRRERTPRRGMMNRSMTQRILHGSQAVQNTQADDSDSEDTHSGSDKLIEEETQIALKSVGIFSHMDLCGVFTGIFLAALLILVISLPIALTGGDMRPTSAPMHWNQPHVYSLLVPRITSASDMNKVGSPQYKVLSYVAITSILDEPAMVIQKYVLSVIYSFNNGDNWHRKRHWMSPDVTVCKWEFVICDDNGGITNLTIPRNNNIQGFLPEEIVHLTSLKVLVLTGNKLFGTLPQRIGELTNLETLCLDQNRFGGMIPSSFGKMANLKTLTVRKNLFVGTIPSSMGSLNQLVKLDLQANSLTGTIPRNVFAGLTNLEYLYLGNNLFSMQRIPKQISSLTNVLRIDLEHTSISGTLPADLFSLSKLEYLRVTDSELIGPIPKYVESSSSLMYLLLPNNRFFNGTIPTELGTLKNLTQLDVSFCALSGSIPSEIGNATSLISVDLPDNDLTGTVPDSIGKLTKLNNMRINRNDIKGSIPDTVCELVNTQSLVLMVDCKYDITCECCEVCT